MTDWEDSENSSDSEDQDMHDYTNRKEERILSDSLNAY